MTINLPREIITFNTLRMHLGLMKLNIDPDNLVYLSRYFNKNFVSLSPIRDKQDGKFMNRIRKRALERMNGGIKISNPRLFYVGSVDFMVVNNGEARNFVILETNGGSGRGLSSIAPGQTEAAFNASKLAIDLNYNMEDQVIVLIGTPVNDALLQEKILLVEFLKEKYQMEGYSVGVYNSFNFIPDIVKEDLVFVIANYNNIMDGLSYRNNHIIFKNKEIDVVIGDGVARRFPIIGAHVKYDLERVETTIVNPVYQVSDDKGDTYLAVKMAEKQLEKYRVSQLAFKKAMDPYELENEITNIIKSGRMDYIIKPLGGSGGAGIQPISPSFSLDMAQDIIEKSLYEFYKKFDARRTAFPYTIQEMADFDLINWESSKRTFDLRFYVIQRDGIFYPLGGLGRIARLPYTGKLNKEEFVVNLSGYGGVETERGVAFSDEGMKTLNLEEEDMIDMLCAACETFNCIVENYSKIVNYEGWDDLVIN
ncbi:MAG: hypothetical protein ACFFCS_03100 [Candidatus Hodarchaeota archaeon]